MFVYGKDIPLDGVAQSLPEELSSEDGATKSIPGHDTSIMFDHTKEIPLDGVR